MWTRRKTFSTTDLAYLNHGTPVHACTCTTSTATTTTNVAHASSCATCLEYCLIPCMDQREAREVLRVVLHRWMTDAEESDLASLAKDPAMLKAFSQLEYFFVGTEGGALLMLPLIPPHFLRLLEQRHPHVQRCREEAESEVAHNQGSPVLLHQHAPHGPVMEVAVHESVVASVAADGCVVVSLFHPHLLPLVAIHHAHPLRCVRLWEGDEAFGAGALHRSASTRLTDEQRRWSAEALQEEEAAIYLITGDQCAVVRLWRVDVIRREHTLQHIFVMVPHLQHQHSSLDVLHREDATPHVARREANMAIHCLAISGNAHLVCGVDEGVYVFSLNRLAWKVKTATTRDDEVCCGHPLGWDEARHAPMTACFAAATTTSEDEEYEAGLRCLRLRALRLVNRHVWVRDTAFVLPMLEQRQHEAGRSSSSVGSPRPPSTWKPKYARTITSGQAIGVVCNEVRLPPSSRTSMEVLLHTVVDVGFEDGELHNDVRLPLACVEPVVYPLQHLPTPGSACVALAVLEAGRRVVGAGSDGRLQLFEWPADGAEEMHPLLVVGGEPAAHRGLGRQLCVLHAPDIFLTCDINDGIVKEWHLHHDTPEVVLRCARQFALKPTAPSSSLGVDVLLPPHKDSVEVASGVSCMTAYAPAAALFLVAACETTIQSYSLAMLMGCELPPDYIFNGHKTVRLPASLMAAVEAEQV